MRKIIIDTDAGSDDAVALIMALREPSIQVLAVTTVAGNVEVSQATQNALLTIARAESYQPPVFQGMHKPLVCDLQTAPEVHGRDGMGDLGFSAPAQQAQPEHAVDAIARLVGAGAGDIELLTLGPLTNIAYTMLQFPDVMRKLPRLTIMGGAHFYTNPHTASAEFNILVDPEAAHIVFGFGIPITLVTLEACRADQAVLTAEEIARLRSSGALGAFCVDCNRTVADALEAARGTATLELPDAAAFAVLARPELAKTSIESETIIELQGRLTRGTTIFRRKPAYFESKPLEVNSTVVTELHGQAFKEYLLNILNA